MGQKHFVKSAELVSWTTAAGAGGADGAAGLRVKNAGRPFDWLVSSSGAMRAA